MLQPSRQVHEGGGRMRPGQELQGRYLLQSVQERQELARLRLML